MTPHESYPISLHDALPISQGDVLRLFTVRSDSQFNTTIYNENDTFRGIHGGRRVLLINEADISRLGLREGDLRSEEHTSELQSRLNLVCRLLLEKTKHKLQ